MFTPVIIEHFSNSRYVGEISDPTIEFEVGNSVCGDRIFIKMRLDATREVNDICFKAYGCATSIATGSLFCDVVKTRGLDASLGMSKAQQHALLGELEPSQIHCRDLLEHLFFKLRDSCLSGEVR